MNTAQEGCGPNPRTYSKAEYDELSVKFATLEAENAKLRAELERRATIFVRLDSGLDEITGLCRHLRQGGCDSTDLLGLEEGLTHAIDMAMEMRTMIAAAPSAPKADDPAKVQLLEALEKIMAAPRRWYGLIVVSEEDEVQARAAIAAARKGERE